MIVVHEKSTNKFIGSAPKVLDNGVLREFTLEELYPNLDPKKHIVNFVDDPEDDPGKIREWELKKDKKGKITGVVEKKQLALKITTDAKDKDGDGMPELIVTELDAASGSDKPGNTATLKVTVMEGARAKKVSGKVKLSTTGGRLSQRVFELKNQTSFTTELRPPSDTITLTVTATGENWLSDSLTFEVMPDGDL